MGRGQKYRLVRIIRHLAFTEKVKYRMYAALVTATAPLLFPARLPPVTYAIQITCDPTLVEKTWMEPDGNPYNGT